MKSLRLLFTGLLFSCLFVFTSCNDDEADATPMDIVDTALAAENLSTLVAALEQANLVSTLQQDGPFTVFAPTNDAFQALLDSNDDWNSLSDIDNDLLANVLKFHVLAADVTASQLTDSYVTTLATGANSEQVVLQIDVTGGVKFNGSAEPVTTDIDATNGTVHIIDEVMLPPNVVELALNNPAFSSLVAALTREDVETDYVSVLTGDGPFTVFAPTNEAFQALLDSNDDWNALGDIPVGTLEAVLNYHVVSGANRQSDELSNGDELTTLNGTLTVDTSNGVSLGTSSGQSVPVAIPNVQGTNGVVHAIGTVLIPE